MHAPAAPPHSLLLTALPVPPTKRLSPSLRRALRAVLAANDALAREGADVHRRLLARAVLAWWRAAVASLAPPVADAPAGSVVHVASCVWDLSVPVDRCALPRATLRALLGRRLHDHLVAHGVARDLREAVALVDDDDLPCIDDALDACCAALRVWLVGEGAATASQVLALRPEAGEGDALRLHPAHAAHFAEARAWNVLLPARASVQPHAIDLRRSAPTNLARLGLHLAGLDALSCDDPWRRGADEAERHAPSLCVDDLTPVPARDAIVADARDRIALVIDQHVEGMITDHERAAKIADLWCEAVERVQMAMRETLALAPSSPWRAMVAAGLAGSPADVRAMTALGDRVKRPDGTVSEAPVLRSLREGLDPASFWQRATEARVVHVQRVLDARAVDRVREGLVATLDDCAVTLDDCATARGRDQTRERWRGESVADFAARVVGRVLAVDVRVGPRGDVLLARGVTLDGDAVARLCEAGVDTVTVRSALACEAPTGVCRVCAATQTQGHAGLDAALSVADAIRAVYRVETLHIGGGAP